MNSHVRDTIRDMNCCKTNLQLLCCEDYYLTLFKEEGLHAFVHNHKTEFGTQMNKLTWYRYVTKFPGMKSDNCSLEEYYGFLKTQNLFDMNLDKKRVSFKHFIVNTSKAICMKNGYFNINSHILNDGIEGAKFQFWENGNDYDIDSTRPLLINKSILMLALLLDGNDVYEINNGNESLLARFLLQQFPLMCYDIISIHFVNSLPYHSFSIVNNIDHIYLSCLQGQPKKILMVIQNFK